MPQRPRFRCGALASAFPDEVRDGITIVLRARARPLECVGDRLRAARTCQVSDGRDGCKRVGCHRWCVDGGCPSDAIDCLPPMDACEHFRVECPPAHAAAAANAGPAREQQPRNRRRNVNGLSAEGKEPGNV
jgi:hypothetical protein